MKKPLRRWMVDVRFGAVEVLPTLLAGDDWCVFGERANHRPPARAVNASSILPSSVRRTRVEFNTQQSSSRR